MTLASKPLIDFSNCEPSGRVYGGLAGKKIGVLFNNVPYMLKFHGNPSYKGILSHGNNPIAEFIASHVFSYLNIPVQETLLGTYRGKQVVACKDFGDIKEFREFMASSNQFDQNDEINRVVSLDISDILYTLKSLETKPFNISGAYERFIQTFVVDALNGNPDRNLGNWGYKLEGDAYSLAPVYDNGSCLFVRFPESEMEQALKDNDRMYQLAISGFVSRFTISGHALNPYTWIENNLNLHEVQQSLALVTSLDIDKVYTCIDSVCEGIQAAFYKELYTVRMNKLKQLNKLSASNTGATFIFNTP